MATEEKLVLRTVFFPEKLDREVQDFLKRRRARGESPKTLSDLVRLAVISFLQTVGPTDRVMEAIDNPEKYIEEYEEEEW